MDLFEYILILTSVIYALAVAQILSGVSRMAQASTAIRHYLPHRIWIFNLFLFIFLIWWATWEFRVVDWKFPQYAYLLIAPTLLFFVCSLLTPLSLEGERADIEAHFLRVRRPFFATYFLAAAVWGYFSSSRKGHTAIALITLAALIGTTVVRFWDPR